MNKEFCDNCEEVSEDDEELIDCEDCSQIFCGGCIVEHYYEEHSDKFRKIIEFYYANKDKMEKNKK